MSAFRRRLASGAIALTLLQLAVLFAAPVSACCLPFRLKAEATQVEKAEAPDCCPAGSHAPGECPLHKGGGAQKSGSDCRMTCDTEHGPQFVLGVTGVLPAPESTRIDLTASAPLHGVPFIATARPSVPAAPPPRLL